MEGLRRRGFPEDVRRLLKQAYKIIYRENRPLADAVVRLKTLAGGSAELDMLVRFLETQTRGIVR
jgi:UDP-N-acetylglucosamine acyltransferase